MILPCTYALNYTFSLKNIATGVSTAILQIPFLAISSHTNFGHNFEVESTNPLHVGVF